MRTLGIIALCVGVLIAGAVIGYISAYPTYTYRYRMTVEVEVDGRIHSGSSVVEVQLVTQPRITTETPRVRAKVHGEAVFVELGGGRNVIALLASGPNASNVDYPKYVVSTHFKLSTVKPEDLEKYSKLEGHRDLQDDRLPTFVTFSDLNDAKTARVVAPQEFEQVFGKDVRFKRAWIEMTNDPVTVGIEAKILGLQNLKQWNAQLRNEPFDINRLRVGSGAFKRENW